MKKLNFTTFSWVGLLLLIMNLLTFQLNAQTTPDIHYQGTTNPTSNIFPFASTNNRVQWLYKPSDFNITPYPGLITKIYIKSSTTHTSVTYANFTIKLGTTTSSAMSTAGWLTNLTTVYSQASQTFTGVTADNWISVTLQTPYFWDGVSNLVLEASVTSTSGMSVRQGDRTENRRVWGTQTSANPVGSNVALVHFGMNIEQGCPQAYNVTVNNLTLSSAQLNWNASTNVNNWNVKYGPVGFNVNTGGTQLTTNTNNITITGLNPATTYDFYIKSNCDTSSSNWTPVNQFTTPCNYGAEPIFSDTFVCGNQSITIPVTVGPTDTVKWYPTATSTNVLATGNTYTTPVLTATTTYYISKKTASGCESSRYPIVVTRHNQPTVNIGNDTTLCQGIQIYANAGSGFTNYLWNNNQSSQSIAISNPGVYHVKATDTNGCVARDTITVTHAINVNKILPDTTYSCLDKTITLDAGNTGSTFQWSINATTQSIQTNAAGLLTVQITTINNCVGIDSTYVLQRDTPVVNLSTYNEICFTDSITLDATNNAGISTYDWNTGATTPTITVNIPQVYSVTVTNDYQCIGRGQSEVAYSPVPTSSGFSFIPYYNSSNPNTLSVDFEGFNFENVTSIKWDFGDGSPMEYGNPVAHVYTQSGTYKVMMYVENNCGENPYELWIHVDVTSGIVNVKNNNELLNIYPNPAQNEIFVDGDIINENIESVRIVDVTGRNINVQFDKTTNGKLHINTNELNAGHYFLLIQTSKQQYSSQFIISK